MIVRSKQPAHSRDQLKDTTALFSNQPTPLLFFYEGSGIPWTADMCMHKVVIV